MKAFARLFIILSIVLFVFGFYYVWLQNDPNRLAFTNYNFEQTYTGDQKDFPIRVAIKNQHINVPVIPASITGNTWDVTENGASYLTSSPIPGNTGNSIIYAHNWASLFRNLTQVKKGDVVEIEFADKSIKKFVIESTATVSPTDASILQPTKEKKLTLYTCAGFFDSKRFVAIAVPQNQLAHK